jgi:hypothetical protein
MTVKVFDGGSGAGYTPPTQTGNSGKFLTTNGTATSWSPTGYTLLGSISATGTTATFTGIDQSYKDLKIVSDGVRSGTTGDFVQVKVNGLAGSTYYPYAYNTGNATTISSSATTNGGYFMQSGNSITNGVLDIYDYANTTINAKPWRAISCAKSSYSYLFSGWGAFNSDTSTQSGIGAITSVSLYASNSWSSGTFYLYGVK